MSFLEIGDNGNGQVLIVLALALLFLGIISFIISRFYKKQGKESPLVVPEDVCCGAHDVCEKESLLNGNSSIEYFEDEELDRFIGKNAHDYSSSEEDEFREVLLTLKEEEVSAWLRSIQLRNINLPETINEEAMLIVRERRFS